jgi:hypothetical protein
VADFTIRVHAVNRVQPLQGIRAGALVSLDTTPEDAMKSLAGMMEHTWNDEQFMASLEAHFPDTIAAIRADERARVLAEMKQAMEVAHG